MNPKIRPQMLASFAPSFETFSEGGGGAPAVTLEAPAPSAPPAEGLPPSTTPAPAAPGGEAPKMYSGEEVSRIVRDRLQQEGKKYEPYQRFGKPEEIEARLTKAERIEKALRGDGQTQPTPEDAEFRKYLEAQYPEIAQMRSVADRAQFIEKRIFDQQVSQSNTEVARMAKEALGIDDPQHLTVLHNMVAQEIASNPDALKLWRETGDLGVVRDAFKSMHDKHLDPLLRAASARYAAKKNKDGQELPPRMPPGGAPAPVSKTEPLSKDARVSGAFSRLSKG